MLFIECLFDNHTNHTSIQDYFRNITIFAKGGTIFINSVQQVKSKRQHCFHKHAVLNVVEHILLEGISPEKICFAGPHVENFFACQSPLISNTQHWIFDI